MCGVRFSAFPWERVIGELRGVPAIISKWKEQIWVYVFWYHQQRCTQFLLSCYIHLKRHFFTLTTRYTSWLTPWPSPWLTPRLSSCLTTIVMSAPINSSTTFYHFNINCWKITLLLGETKKRWCWSLQSKSHNVASCVCSLFLLTNIIARVLQNNNSAKNHWVFSDANWEKSSRLKYEVEYVIRFFGTKLYYFHDRIIFFHDRNIFYSWPDYITADIRSNPEACLHHSQPRQRHYTGCGLFRLLVLPTIGLLGFHNHRHQHHHRHHQHQQLTPCLSSCHSLGVGGQVLARPTPAAGLAINIWKVFMMMTMMTLGEGGVASVLGKPT